LKSQSEKPTKNSFLFQFETFSQIEDALELIFSPSAAAVILYMTAIKCGVHTYKKMKKKIHTEEEALNHLSELKKEENWGKLSFRDISFKNATGRVIIHDSFETIARKTTQPSCHFFRGYIAGFLSELFKNTITVTEEKCAGKGDEHCEFVFEPQ